ncbi:MAG: serine hydrolase [Ardenticatenales bacterium]|nr:serine hydrolase [Ardenticatenales bacterium]
MKLFKLLSLFGAGLVLLGCQGEAASPTSTVAATDVPATAALSSTETATTAAMPEPSASATPSPTKTPAPADTISTEASQDTTAARVARINEFIAAQTDAGLRGAILVALDGTIVVATGLGEADDRAGLANDADTVFDIGSITKQFTAAAILKLEMAGLLSTEDTLGDFFPDAPADKAGITLHQLLTHSAGLPEALGDDYAPILRAEYIDLALNTPLEHAPGEAYLYSNVGYSLLAAIIELVSGQSYEAYLHEALFLPAGMLHTGYLLPDWSNSVIATGYRDGQPVGKPNQLPWAEDGPYWHLRGNGGILSTANDMYRWHLALQGDTVLSAAAREKLLTPYVPEDEAGSSYYAYGWVIIQTTRGTTLITHNGGNGIFYADYWDFPEEQIFIFIATNGLTRPQRNWASELAQIIHDPDYVPAPPILVVETEAAELPATPAGQLVAEFLAAINSDDVALRTAFIENTYASELMGFADLDGHLAIMSDLQELLRSATLSSVGVAGDTLILTYVDSSGLPYLEMSLTITPSDPPMLADISIEG